MSSIRALELREAAPEEQEVVPEVLPEHSWGVWPLEPPEGAPGMGMPRVVDTSMPVTK